MGGTNSARVQLEPPLTAAAGAISRTRLTIWIFVSRTICYVGYRRGVSGDAARGGWTALDHCVA